MYYLATSLSYFLDKQNIIYVCQSPYEKFSALLIFTKSTMDLQIINRNGGHVLLYEGRQYHKQKLYRNGSIIWYCSERRKALKCTGSVTTLVSSQTEV